MTDELPPEERSTQRTTTGEGIGHPNDFLIRILTLADHAASERKLYINGAGIDRIQMGQFPGALPSLFLVVRIAVPHQAATEEHTVFISIFDQDHQPIGERNPLVAHKVETGRPPGYRPGDELCIQLVVGLLGMPIKQPGTIYFDVAIDEVERTIGRLPLKITPPRR